MRSSRILIPLAVSALAFQAQQPELVLRVSTTLIQVDAIVTTPDGHHIADLTPADFTILEDGKPRDITHFSYIAKPTSGSASANRTLAIIVDDFHTSTLNLARIRPDLHKFADTQLTRNDLVSISNVRSAPPVSFTSDPTVLREAIDVATAIPPADSEVDCTLAFSRFNATIDRISAETRAMRNLPGRKALVLMSDGLSIPTVESTCGSSNAPMHNAIERITEDAARAGVTLYTQDTTGLATKTLDASYNSAAPAGSVLPGGPGDAMALYVHQAVSAQGLQQSQQNLRNTSIAGREVPQYLTSQTGGFSAEGHNDLLEAINKSLDDMSGYYLMSFQPAPGDFELKNSEIQWHKIEVRLKARGLLVRSTKGFAGTPGTFSTDGLATSAPGEAKRQIDEAFTSGEQRNDLPAHLRAEFFKDGNRATVTVTARIDAAKLPYRKENGRDRDDLTLVVGLFDQNGNFVSATQKIIEVRLREERLGVWMQSGIVNKTDFNVQPGKYLVRLVVRDAEGQSMAEQSTGVEIPW